MLRKLLMLAIVVILFGSCRTAKTAPYVEPAIGLNESIKAESKDIEIMDLDIVHK